MRMFFDLVGAQRICLITDAMAASGMPDGTYTLGGQDLADVVVVDDDFSLHAVLRRGSWLTING